jgi:hypothetical protein
LNGAWIGLDRDRGLFKGLRGGVTGAQRSWRDDLARGGSTEIICVRTHGGDEMADDRLPEAIIGRLSRTRTIESEFADRLDQLAAAGAFDEAGTEVFTRLAAVAARHRRALEEVAIRRGAELQRRTRDSQAGPAILNGKESWSRHADGNCGPAVYELDTPKRCGTNVES